MGMESELVDATENLKMVKKNRIKQNLRVYKRVIFISYGLNMK
jgi:hypothetical protein